MSAAVRQRLLASLKRSRGATLAAYSLDGLRAKLTPRIRPLSSRSGLVHEGIDLEDSLRYIERVHGEYLQWSAPGALRGRIAEVGPGDSSGVALLLRAGGAERVDLVDRFDTQRDPLLQARIYRALAQRHPALAPLLEGVDLTREADLPGLRRWVGEEAAAERFFRQQGPFDAIVSCAVLEHLYDPLAALGDMAAALAPGGWMLHKVDLRDHGLLSAHHGELAWLETPSWLHRLMTHHSGRPNRVLYPAYREALGTLGLEARLLVTALAGVGDLDPFLPLEDVPAAQLASAVATVRATRSRMAPCFRGASDAELAVTGLFLVARKAP